MKNGPLRVVFLSFFFLVLLSGLGVSRAYALPTLSASLLEQDPIKQYASTKGANFLGIAPDKSYIVLCTNASRTLNGWQPVSDFPDNEDLIWPGARYYLDPKGGSYDIYHFADRDGKFQLVQEIKGSTSGCLVYEGISSGPVDPPPAKDRILTIRYVYADGSTAAQSVSYTFAAGRPYSITSPNVVGHAPDQAVLSGTMPDFDQTLTVTYTPKSYTLTLKYVYAGLGGATAAPSKTYTLQYGQRYSYPSPVISGYTASPAIVSGTMVAGNSTITVVYSAAAHTLTVQYVFEDGSTAASTVTRQVQRGEAYSIPSPVVRGFVPDLDPVAGTMPDTDKIVIVRYTPSEFRLTIHFVFEDGSQAAPDQSYTVPYGDTYDYAPPAVSGFVPNPTVVRGLMLDYDQEVVVTYSPRRFSLTINYLLQNGNTALPSAVYQVAGGKPYAYPSPGKAGYSPDILVVSGTMPNGDKVVNVTYYPERSSLTVRYVYSDGTRAAPSVSVTLYTDQPYSFASPSIKGYVADRPVVSGSKLSVNETITVTYRREGESGGDDGSSGSSGGSSGPSGGSSSGPGGGSSSGPGGFPGDGGGLHRPGDLPDASVPPGGYLPDDIENDFHIQGPTEPDLGDFDWNFWDPSKHTEGALQFKDDLPMPEVTLPGIPEIVPGDPGGPTADPLDPDTYGFKPSDKDYWYYLEKFGVHRGDDAQQ